MGLLLRRWLPTIQPWPLATNPPQHCLAILCAPHATHAISSGRLMIFGICDWLIVLFSNVNCMKLGLIHHVMLSVCSKILWKAIFITNSSDSFELLMVLLISRSLEIHEPESQFRVLLSQDNFLVSDLEIGMTRLNVSCNPNAHPSVKRPSTTPLSSLSFLFLSSLL